MKSYTGNSFFFKRTMRFALNLTCALGLYASLSAAPILLKSGTINPPPTTRSTLTIQSLSAKSQGMLPGVYIIQSKAIITPSWRKELLATGAKIRSYIPENAYLIEADEDCLESILKDLSYDNLIPYISMYKYDTVASALARETQIKAKALQIQGNQVGAASLPEEESAPFTISLWDSTGQAQLRQVVTSHAGCKIIKQDGDVMIAELTGEALEAIALLPTIHWVEEYIQPKLFNDVALQPARMNVTPTWPDGGTGWDLTGAGQVVAVCDTGLDTGVFDTLHEDVRGRTTRAYARGRGTWDDPDGHGTHVAGSVLGNGAQSEAEIRGAAYEATLIFQSIMDRGGNLGGLPADLNESLFPQTYQKEGEHLGARIHTNSWGSSTSGRYTTNSRSVDEFAFNHPDFLILVAAGNDGIDRGEPHGVIDTDSMGAPATAKNCLTVGASENHRETGGYATMSWNIFGYQFNPILTDRTSLPDQGGIQGMAAFSSRGPCDDGRIKPDIVAPGTNILSLKSSISDVAWGAFNDYYHYSGGTSMSTPLVAGTAALVREWLVEYQHIPNPDGATIKALLMAGAKTLYPGQYGTGATLEIPNTYPNNVEGWGQVDLVNTLGEEDVDAVVDTTPVIFDAQVVAQGETKTWKIQATKGADITILLAYSDAPASTISTKQLINDLDLLVTTPENGLLYPNSGTVADRINNVESVRITNAVAGIYTISIKGHSIPTPMDTTLTNGVENAQRFSLVVNGAKLMIQIPESIQIQGVDSIYSESDATYTCQAIYPVTSPITIRPTWTLPNGANATISESGILTTTKPPEEQIITLTALYDGVTATKEITIIPVDRIMVTFDPQGGTVSSLQERYIVNSDKVSSTYDFLPIPTKEGTPFLGWHTAETGGAEVTTSSLVLAEITTLYARWLIHPNPLMVLDVGGEASSSLTNNGSLCFFSYWELPDWISGLTLEIDGEKVSIPSNTGFIPPSYTWTGPTNLTATAFENRTGEIRTWELQILIIELDVDVDTGIETETFTQAVLKISQDPLPPPTLSESLDDISLTFTTDEDTPWFGQRLITYDGIDAAQSGLIGDNGTSWMRTTLVSSGILSFQWKVSSESKECDYVEFLINGVEQDRIGGTSSNGWALQRYEIPSGTNTIMWRYRKDASSSQGSDCAWVDQIVWQPDLEVQNVVATSRWPFGNEVDLSYDVVGHNPETKVDLTITGYDQTRNRSTPIKWENLRTTKNGSTTSYSYVWNVDAALPANFESSSYMIKVAQKKEPPPPLNSTDLYYVIDLSKGPEATKYPVTNLKERPLNGWTDMHKTNKLVLRRIEAGSFIMGSPDGTSGTNKELGRGDNEDEHPVRMTQPYYIGVFEITQRQWELVMGNNPSQYKGDTRPVDHISYNLIRGSKEGALWPENANVDEGSFIHKLREKTGLNFDLPTEAQWEYACRAGTKTALNDAKFSMNELGRYKQNQSDGKGGNTSYHVAVGSYEPNDWELYDMHGNVFEWCLDWYQASLGDLPAINPEGATSGEDRVLRSGSWLSNADQCRSANRHRYNPSTKLNVYGLRVMTRIGRGRSFASQSTLSDVNPQQSSFNATTTSTPGESSVFRIDTRTTQGRQIVSGIVQLPTYNGEVTLTHQGITPIGPTTLSELWDTTTHPDGWYTLNQSNVSVNVLVLNEPLVLEGRLENDLTLTNDRLIVIRGDMILPPRWTLTINNATILKFAPGTILESFGGKVEAYGAHFTYLADDTLLGDTNHDEDATTPPTNDPFTSRQKLLHVTFDAQYPDAPSHPVQTYTSGTTYGQLPTPLRDEYNFKGWYAKLEEAEDNIVIISNTPIPEFDETTTISVYAHWRAKSDVPLIVNQAYKTWLTTHTTVSNGNYNAASFALSPNGKRDIHGKPLRYWQEYVVGTDPEKSDDVFQAFFVIIDDKPVLRWKPNLGSARVYIQEGKVQLSDPWVTPPPTEAKFYRVRVQMPENLN